MTTRIDHVVLWADDPLRSIEFYERVVGLSGIRVEEYRAGDAPFPSVRVDEGSIIDVMSRRTAAMFDGMEEMAGSAGHPVNHLCLAMDQAEYDALRERLAAHGVAELVVMRNSFGARGLAPTAVYFADPDRNVIEARYYE